MDLLLILTYAAICIVIFKVFKIPLTKWTVPTAVLGGVVIISALILVLKYSLILRLNKEMYFFVLILFPLKPWLSVNALL